MLLQAYDFLRLHVDHGCNLQFGGSDQWGNITMGVELIRKVCGDEVWGFTTPLIVKPDGTKYGKTETGTVWLDARRTSPFAMYQFFVNTPDEQVGELLRFLTFLDHEEIDASTPRRPSARNSARPNGHWPAPSWPRPRRRRGSQVRGGFGGAVRRGDRRPERGDAPGRDRGRADDRRAPRRAAGRRPHPRRRPRAHRAGQVAGRRPPDHRGREAPTSTTCARPTRRAAWAPTTSSTTATWSCARGAARSTSSRPHERRRRTRRLGSAVPRVSPAWR